MNLSSGIFSLSVWMLYCPDGYCFSLTGIIMFTIEQFFPKPAEGKKKYCCFLLVLRMKN